MSLRARLNLLITGLLLIGFVILAPKGLVGLWQSFTAGRKQS